MERGNSLWNDTIWDPPKQSSSADDKSREAKLYIFVLIIVECIAEKRQTTDDRYILLFLQCFQRLSSIRPLKVGNVWQMQVKEQERNSSIFNG